MYQRECLFCNVWVGCFVDTVKSTLSTISVLVLHHLNFVWMTYPLLEYIVNVHLTSSHIHFMKLGTAVSNVCVRAHVIC